MEEDKENHKKRPLSQTTIPQLFARTTKPVHVGVDIEKTSFLDEENSLQV